MIKIKVLGAARNVTGSRFVVETNGSRVLIDCGLYQERTLRARNWGDFPVPPSSLDAVILTHAHLDHCGYLPKLVREGFDGGIFCTPPTGEIARIALLDSGKLQEEDAHYKKTRHEREEKKGPYPEIPLYTIEEAEKVFPRFEAVPYGEPLKVSPSIEAVFRNAGHILGSAMVEMTLKDGGSEKKLVFSGDIGRWNNPLLDDPVLFEEADYVIMESTYGNRLHDGHGSAAEQLREVIVASHKAGGNIVIPTFAIERAQEIIYCLRLLLQEDKIPPLTVFMDSPMALDITEIYNKFPGYLAAGTDPAANGDESPFRFPLLKATRTTDESREINNNKESAIIIAGSGMCTGGRIKYHLLHNISQPRNTVLFVGYQAEGTLGRSILEKAESVRILGQTCPVRARVKAINGFSGHADMKELLRWLSAFNSPPRKIFIVHGEEAAAENLAGAAGRILESELIVPEYLDEFEL